MWNWSQVTLVWPQDHRPLLRERRSHQGDGGRGRRAPHGTPKCLTRFRCRKDAATNPLS